jgi:hypothetical protein
MREAGHEGKCTAEARSLRLKRRRPTVDRVTPRCPKTYDINGRVEQCVKDIGHTDECQLNLWLAVKVPILEPSIGTAIDAEMSIRRVS